MKIGYIRISRDKQTTALQEDALKKEECERIFTDKLSGKNFERPEFLRMLDIVRAGDIIIVWRLDRLGRSLIHLVETVNTLNERGIELRSLRENIDTSTPSGKLMFHIMASLAEFEHDIIMERTAAGMEAARARGRIGGRPPLSLPPQTIARARELYEGKEMSVKEICRMTGIKRSSFYTYVVGEETKGKKETL